MKKIIFGPPGTGKTTRLLNIVEQELRIGVPPDRIAYLAFTRKAAQEAVQRACTKFKLVQLRCISSTWVQYCTAARLYGCIGTGTYVDLL